MPGLMVLGRARSSAFDRDDQARNHSGSTVDHL